MGEESDLTHLRKLGGQIHRWGIGQVRGLGCTQASLEGRRQTENEALQHSQAL